MSRTIYLLAGVGAGFALAENKAALTSTILGMTKFSKEFATELKTVKFNNQKLGDMPVLKDVLAYLSSFKVSEKEVDQGVTAARGVVRSAVKTTGTLAAGYSAAPVSSSGSSLLRKLLILAVPAAAAYVYYDPALRAQATMYGRRAAELSGRGLDKLKAVVDDPEYRAQILKRAAADLVVVRRRAEELAVKAKEVAAKRLVEYKAVWQDMRARSSQGSTHHAVA